MDRLKSILVAVDFSPCSADAFKQAARIAAWSSNGRSALAALHVIALPTYMPAPHALIPFDLPIQADYVLAAHQDWKHFAARCAAQSTVEFDIAVGSPRCEILARVHRDKPDLLVLGLHGVADAQQGIGPTAAACVQRAETKVLLVRAGQAGPFKSVVACIDFTETSHLALEQAVRVAAEDGAVLHILTIYDDPWYGIRPPTGMEANMPDFKAQYQRAVEDRLRTFCAPLGHEINALKAVFHGLESAWRGGGYGHAIVAFVKREGCDLAVLGTRAKWNLRDFFWGTTAQRVAGSAPCSILAIKPAPPRAARGRRSARGRRTHIGRRSARLAGDGAASFFLSAGRLRRHRGRAALGADRPGREAGAVVAALLAQADASAAAGQHVQTPRPGGRRERERGGHPERNEHIPEGAAPGPGRPPPKRESVAVGVPAAIRDRTGERACLADADTALAHDQPVPARVLPSDAPPPAADPRHEQQHRDHCAAPFHGLPDSWVRLHGRTVADSTLRRHRGR